MDLLADLKIHVEAELKTHGVSYSPAQPVEKLLLLVLNREAKNVDSRVRQVFVSQEFSAKRATLSAQQQTALDAILDKFRVGADVAGHLSKRSIQAKAVDGLLANWGIFHLHISTHKQSPTDAFYARTEPVMFAHIADEAAYFIDIYPHGSAYPEAWTRQELIKIVKANWPYLLERHTVKGAQQVAFQPTDLELKKLHASRINSLLQIGDRIVIPPGGGVTCDGTPLNHVLRMQNTVKRVHRLEQQMASQAGALKEKIAKDHGVPEEKLDFALYSTGGDWGIIEVFTKTVIDLGKAI